jgi:hypothetical protein
MAVGFPVKDDYATGDVLTAVNMNDFAGTLNTVPDVIGGFAAGKNKIINGDFNVNQRAFTSATTAGSYTFDRWRVGVATGGTSTFTTEAFTPGAAPVAGYESKNFLQIVTTGQSAVGDGTSITQRIESTRTFAGQTVTVSFFAKAASGTPGLSIELSQNFGSGGSSAVLVQGQKATLSTSWARYSLTFAIPSISGKTIGTSDYFDLAMWVSSGSSRDARLNNLGIQSNTFQIWGVQVEAGSIATPFQTASGSIGGELALAQRYYYRFTPTSAAQRLAYGYCNTTTSADLLLAFPVQMRTAPTALETSGTATDYSVRTSGNTVTACSAVPAFAIASPYSAEFNFTVASGLTAGTGAGARAVNTNAYLGWSAEL